MLFHLHLLNERLTLRRLVDLLGLVVQRLSRLAPRGKAISPFPQIWWARREHLHRGRWRSEKTFK